MASGYKRHVALHYPVIWTLYLKNRTYFTVSVCRGGFTTNSKIRSLNYAFFLVFKQKFFYAITPLIFFTTAFETPLRGKKKKKGGGQDTPNHLMYFVAFVEVPLSHSEINGIFFFNPKLNYGN